MKVEDYLTKIEGHVNIHTTLKAIDEAVSIIHGPSLINKIVKAINLLKALKITEDESDNLVHVLRTQAQARLMMDNAILTDDRDKAKQWQILSNQTDVNYTKMLTEYAGLSYERLNKKDE